jgi:SHS2 domain-containing protein
MKKFEFLDITTADVAFAAYGKSLDELFANAALAMFDVIINTEQVEPKVKRKIEVKGNDLKSLMFNWLNELLVFVDGERLVFSNFKVKVDGDKHKLSAECMGEEMDAKKHELRTEVKAATYHKLEVKKGKLWRAQVILDI